jgi:hypothetical protein
MRRRDRAPLTAHHLPGVARRAAVGIPAPMSHSRDPSRRPDMPPPPNLPELDSPPPADLLSSVPSKDELIGDARSPGEIIGEQQSVDELLRRYR